MPAAGGIRDRDQTCRFDIRATDFATRERAGFEPAERTLDQVQFASRGLLECLKDFVVLDRDGGIRRVAGQGVVRAVQILLDTPEPVTELVTARHEARASDAQIFIVGVHGGIVAPASTPKACDPLLMMSGILRTPADHPPLHTEFMFSSETQALMEAAVDAVIVIDHRGRMLAVNDSTRRIFGFRADELLGKNVSMLMPEPDRGSHDAYLARYLQTGVARIIGLGREVTAQRSDGTLFPARLSVGRIPDSDPPRFVGLLRDTTSEHEATAALKRERDRANAYLELNDAILLSLDPERRICEVNARGSDLLGAPREEIRGRDWLDFLGGPSERERGQLMLAKALATGTSREREFESNVNGEARKIYWRCIARRDADGSPAGWLCSGADVTERMRQEEHALLAQDRLTRVARLATLGEMAAGVAHELNQPLTAITTYARACEHFVNMPVPDLMELREAVREIGAEGLRAAGIITRLRQLVRNDEHVEHVPTDINSLIEDLKILLNADARVYDTRLTVSLTSELPQVNANPVQLQQLVLNLVRNAFEALAELPPGKRELAVSTVLNPSGDVEIRVTDNGPGISPAIADRLFDPFSTTKKSGTGLGLPISRTIAHSHGGTIESRPMSSQGASFHVRLPAAEALGS